MGWKSLKYKCPRDGTHLVMYGRYPGGFRCPKCDRVWQLTMEGLWRLVFGKP